MAHRLLVIEDSSSPNLVGVHGLLAEDRSFICERTSWSAFPPERLRGHPAHLIVAVAASRTPQPLQTFQWLRRNPIPTPTLAVLPDGAEEVLVKTAAEAADDFIVSPLRAGELRHRLARLLGEAPQDLDSVRQRLTEEMGLRELVGTDPAFLQVCEAIPRIARSDAPVLITGETGTGKELCARAVHHLSRRRSFPFIAVDCGAIPDHLIENEMFGHARGAFTDAHRDQRGLVAMAEGGTLFLDEVDALSPAAQGKLLRFLQEHTFRPLGSDRFVRADVNVIAATNADLASCVRHGQFRSDLYFRLNVLQLHLPPLRERRADVALLARHFLESLAEPSVPVSRTFSAGALRKLVPYDWPGNVRELFNVVRRAAVLCDGGQILSCHVTLPGAGADGADPCGDFRSARAVAIESFERRYVEELLRKHAGNVTHAAREAQKDRRAFGRLMKKYRIERRSL